MKKLGRHANEILLVVTPVWYDRPFYVYLFSLPVLTVYSNTHMLCFQGLWKKQIYSPFFIIEVKESTLSQISCKQLCSPDSLKCITAERTKAMGNSEIAGYISVQKTKTHIFLNLNSNFIENMSWNLIMNVLLGGSGFLSGLHNFCVIPHL